MQIHIYTCTHTYILMTYEMDICNSCILLHKYNIATVHVHLSIINKHTQQEKDLICTSCTQKLFFLHSEALRIVILKEGKERRPLIKSSLSVIFYLIYMFHTRIFIHAYINVYRYTYIIYNVSFHIYISHIYAHNKNKVNTLIVWVLSPLLLYIF